MLHLKEIHSAAAARQHVIYVASRSGCLLRNATELVYECLPLGAAGQSLGRSLQSPKNGPVVVLRMGTLVA
jgi:hypothetical protein